MTLSLAELDTWDPDAIGAVFAAIVDQSDTTRQTSQGLGQVMGSVPWQGAAHDAATAAAAGIQKDLELHAEQLDAVAAAARVGEAEVRGIKADWYQICRMADRWGIAIDIDTNEIVPPNPLPTDPEVIAEVRHRMEVLHDEIVELMVRADNADRDLAAAISGATGAMSALDVNRELNDDASNPEPDGQRARGQAAAFRGVYGRTPVSENDWRMAAALDPHSYTPRYRGVPAQIVAGRFTPQPGRGVLRSNLFIPADKVYNTAKDLTDVRAGRLAPMNYGDDRGPSAQADPEASRVSVFVDYDHGVVAVRQNPTVTVDGKRGGAAAAVPTVHVVQAADGRMTIDYDAHDAYEIPVATAAGLTVNGRITLSPEAGGAVGLGGNTTIYPSMETYQYRDGQTPAQLQWNPANSGSAYGPATSLMRHHGIGDATIEPVRPIMPGWQWELDNVVGLGDPFLGRTTRLRDPATAAIPTVVEGR